MNFFSGESQAYYCDCCDPARQKKRQYSSSEEEDEDEEAEAEDLDEELTSSSVDSKAEKTENNTPKQTANQPGWFGKGRRKRTRCWKLPKMTHTRHHFYNGFSIFLMPISDEKNTMNNNEFLKRFFAYQSRGELELLLQLSSQSR